MSVTTQHKPGTLVHYRQRDWMVLPSELPELLRIKPLGGSDEEETAVYLPLKIPGEDIKSAEFPQPNPTLPGSFETARLLYDAFRLSFRNAAGPFRCMGKLSFRPRAYQLVPLVMALKHEVPRLLIADDVGIGKTVEALIILKELMERGEVRRFAVICPPHLCEQWQEELKAKLDIDAEIIRSSTAAKLDRRLPDDQSVFHHLPYQVVSIDYIKADKRRGVFINHCPELIIVDEAHTCTLPAGAKAKSQQQRYALLHDLAQDANRRILLLTATPHSGKDSEFTSLLGLLKTEFKHLDFETIETAQRKKLARHFVQRKRESIKRWLHEKTEFPERESKEVHFTLTNDYLFFYQHLLQFAKQLSASGQAKTEQARLLRSWAAISLIKGCMSSPAMAMEMLARRRQKLDDSFEEEALPETESLESSLFEELNQVNDVPRNDLVERIDFATSELQELRQLHNEAQSIFKNNQDQKIEAAIRLIKQWVRDGFSPIVFCHYIPTARYVAQKLKEALPSTVDVQAITSELPDEDRRERIERMGKSEKRVLVATDCLSEGINLQDHFTAVLHYDLPWNPNRLEQREGRVDRFGQSAPLVKTFLLYGDNNEMDTFILEVLIKKVRDIQKSTGVSISIGENSKSLMTEAAQRLFYNRDAVQARLFQDTEESVSNELELARKKGENIRSIFAHESIDPETIKADLEAVDEAIGDIQSVAHFVTAAIQQLGGSVTKAEKGYKIQVQNLPAHISRMLGKDTIHKISFDSPMPKGYTYIGRNHKFTELLCQFLISLSIEPRSEYGRIARVCELQTDDVQKKTVLVLFRVRNVIKEVASKRESIAEEMFLWGYRIAGSDTQILPYEEAKKLLLQAKTTTTFSAERQEADLKHEFERFDGLKPQFLQIASDRADELVNAHSRFKELVGGRRYEKATPVLPPDVMGVYILLPKPKAI